MSRWATRALAFAWIALAAPCAFALGQKAFVGFNAGAAGVVLANDGRAASLYVDPNDHAGVIRAASDLAGRHRARDGRAPGAREGSAARGPRCRDHRHLGKSALIDALVKAGILDVSAIRGKWEGWLVQAVEHPLPGVERALVIAGTDKRGTIFGIYEISEQIGVSPWYWWADVPVDATRRTVFVAGGTRVNDAPVVQYRGIFLNDEEPALTRLGASRSTAATTTSSTRRSSS